MLRKKIIKKLLTLKKKIIVYLTYDVDETCTKEIFVKCCNIKNFRKMKRKKKKERKKRKERIKFCYSSEEQSTKYKA